MSCQQFAHRVLNATCGPRTSHHAESGVTLQPRLYDYADMMAATLKPTAVRGLAFALLSIVLSGLAHADTAAPQFTARTLDGQTFTNSSLRGNVVLLQFWTTWCPVCHQDQAVVDHLQAAFGGSGLVVVAVDDGEPEAVVRQYLQASPRSVPVVVSDGHSLAARFGVHSYPHYVVIDRNGNVAANQGGGGGGEAYLRYLLRSAGMPPKVGTVEASNRQAPATPSGPQLVYVPPTKAIVPVKAIPKTIFVFTDGARLEADQYELHSTFLHVSAEGQDRSIPLNALDIKKTIAVNRERGINIKIPSSANEVFLAF